MGRRYIVTHPAPQLDPAVVDVSGSDLNLILGALSLMGEEVVGAIASCMKGLWVETATGSALDRVAFDRYGLSRQSANPATVDLTFSRPTPGGATPGTYAAGSIVQSLGGIQFATNLDAVFGDFDTTVTVPATALVAGPTGNLTAGSLTVFGTPAFDPALSVTNAQTAAGGTDAEEDTDYKSRIRGFFPTLRRGTLGAIEFGARQVPGVAVAKAYEITNPINGIPAGAVQLVVADLDGGSSSLMVQAVEDILIYYRAAGIPVFVSGGTVQYQPIVWDIDFTAGTNSQLAAEDIRAVTVATAQFLAGGETLLRSSLIAGARGVTGAIVSAGSLVTPVGDIVPASTSSMIRIRPEDVSFI